MLLAARMNNFRRSVEEIVQVVKIADTTLKKRLDEFKATPSGSLTLADFRNVWLDEEMDPPAFTKGREREEAEKEEAEQAAMENTEEAENEMANGKVKRGKKGKEKENGKKSTKKKKRKREESEEGQVDANEEETAAANGFHPRPAVDPTLLNEGILEGTMEPLPLFIPDPGGDDSDYNIDPALLHHAQFLSQTPMSTSACMPSLLDSSTSTVEETVSTALAEEVSIFLQNSQGTMLREALDEAEQRRLAQIPVVDELMGLDEDELDRFLLSEEEVKIRERVWVELNKDYLEAIAGEFTLYNWYNSTDAEELLICFVVQQKVISKSQVRLPRAGRFVSRLCRKLSSYFSFVLICFPLSLTLIQRRKTNKPRDATTAHGSTAAESVQNLIKKNPKYSKRINYDALKDLFVEGGGPPSLAATMGVNDEKDDAELYTFGDDKSEEEAVVIIEDAGTVTAAPKRPTHGAAHSVEEDADIDAEGEDASDEEKGDDQPFGWEYEQEL